MERWSLSPQERREGSRVRSLAADTVRIRDGLVADTGHGWETTPFRATWRVQGLVGRDACLSTAPSWGASKYPNARVPGGR